MKKIQKWFFTDYTQNLYEKEDFKKIIQYFIVILMVGFALLSVPCLILGWTISLYLSISGALLMVLALALFKNNFIGTSIALIFSSLFVTVTISAITGSGLYDVVLTVYMIIIAVASLIVKTRGYLIVYATTILTLGIITYFSTTKNYEYHHLEDLWADFAVLIIIITVFSIIMRILANTMKFYHQENVNKEIAIIKKDKEIQLSHEKIHYLYDHLQDIYFECDLAGHLRTISPQIAAVLQYSPKKLYYSNIRKLLVNQEQLRDIIGTIKIARKITNYELSLSDRNGKTHFTRLNASVIKDSNNNLIIAGTIEDITEKKLMNDKIQQFQKLDSLGSLAGTMAHDFNNLITIIGINSELLMTKLNNSNSEITNHAQTIIDATKKASTLTRQILDFSRTQKIKPVITSLNQIIEDFIKFSTKLIPDTMTVNLKLEESLPNITIDKSQMEQILMNLLLNARDAILDKKSDHTNDLITISTSLSPILTDMILPDIRLKKGEYIQISVKDTGVGINMEMTQYVFEPFYSSKGDKGTGLGLSSVYGIVRQNGGDILVDSIPGKGTTFTIYWPLSKD